MRQKPVLRARMELIKGFAGNPAICLKYLERKRPDEFKPVVAIENPTLKEQYEAETEKLRLVLKTIIERVRATSRSES